MRIFDEFEQLSEKWFETKCGKISMSHAKELLTGGEGKTRATYLRGIAAEIIGGRQNPGYQSSDMVRGMELEPFALRAYQVETGMHVKKIGFVLMDNEQIGCSPDGLTETMGVEIKCPIPNYHLQYLDREIVQREHGPQMQGNMWVCEREAWDFISFCPWIKERPIIIHRVVRDQEVIDRLSVSAIRGIDEIKEMIDGVKYGPGHKLETAEIVAEAKKYWESYFMNGESKVQL